MKNPTLKSVDIKSMKTCGKCKQSKPLTEYNKNKTTKDGLHRDCRTCKKEDQAKWYAAHAEEQKARVQQRNKLHSAQLRALIIKAKDVPCVDCKVKYPSYVMDFDHLPGTEKIAIVSAMVQARRPEQIIIEEIRKCEVVCANCHRIRTFTRTGS